LTSNEGEEEEEVLDANAVNEAGVAGEGQIIFNVNSSCFL